MKRLIKPLWLALATLSALLTVVSCVKELAVKEQEVNFESSLTTEQSQIVKGDSTVTTQLLINEEKVDCPRPTKYSVSFTYDEEAGTLFFLGDSIQSGKPIALSSLSNLSLTYQAKKLVGNKVDVTVSNDAPKKLSKELVWNILADKTYWVKSELEGDGEITITGADDLDAVEPDTKLAVTAKPADGWELVTLTANEEDILEDKSFEVSENTIVRATFKELAPKTYKVTLTKEGDGTVAISGADNLDAVVTGSKLTVTAEPADGWSIASMTANGVDILASSSFVVDSDTNVKVVFKKQPPKTYKVTLVKEGDGTVAISGTDNLGAVVAGSKLTVTATPADGWEVKSITANGKGITTDKSFVVTSNTVVKVVFKKQPPKTYAVTLTKEGEGKVDISGADDLGAVVTGTKLTVTAEPADGWEVKSITANGKDITAEKSFVVTSNTTVKVVFKKQPPKTYKVTLTKVGDGTVAISGADNLGAVVAGSKLTVTATPADGWGLVRITANGVDILASKSFEVKSDTNVKVVFKKKPSRTRAVRLVQEGEGEVVITGADNLTAVKPGTKLAVSATPADGWELVSMTANEENILEKKSFVLYFNTTVKVVFKRLPPKTYAVTLTKEGEGKVDISGADNLDAVVTGSKLTVTATPADGWEVKSITANGKDITAEKSFVVTSNTVVKVVFKKQPPKTYAVTLTMEGDVDWETDRVEVVLPDGSTENLEVGKSYPFPAGTKLEVRLISSSWDKHLVASITANGVEVRNRRENSDESKPSRYIRSFIVTSDTHLKVVYSRKVKPTVDMSGRGKISITFEELAIGKSRVSTLQDDPDKPDNAGYAIWYSSPFSSPTKVTITAKPADGWELEGISANNVDITASKTFTMTSDTLIRVLFRKKTSSKTYKVTVVCSEGGSIELKRYNRIISSWESVDLDRVPDGSDLKVFPKSNEGYRLCECFFNGKAMWYGVINEDTEIRATFCSKR